MSEAKKKSTNTHEKKSRQLPNAWIVGHLSRGKAIWLTQGLGDQDTMYTVLSTRRPLRFRVSDERCEIECTADVVELDTEDSKCQAAVAVLANAITSRLTHVAIQYCQVTGKVSSRSSWIGAWSVSPNDRQIKILADKCLGAGDLFEPIITRVAEGEITADEAIHELDRMAATSREDDDSDLAVDDDDRVRVVAGTTTIQ